MLELVSAPANPLAAVIGSGTATTNQGQSVAGNFQHILGVSPTKPASADGSTDAVTGASDTKNSELMAIAATSGMIALLIPSNLIATLGTDTQTAASSTGDNTSQGSTLQGNTSQNGAASTELVKAELVAKMSGKSAGLCLKILPDTVKDDTDSSVPSTVSAGQTETDGMILPLDLRTVAQEGNRIIADGFLQTTTGEEAPVRIKLEFAGPLTVNDKMESSAASLPTTVESSTSASGKTSQLPQLMRDLGVTSMVIENVATKPSPVVAALLPGATVKGTGSSSAGQASTPLLDITKMADGQLTVPVQSLAATAAQSENQQNLDTANTSLDDDQGSSTSTTTPQLQTGSAGVAVDTSIVAPPPIMASATEAVDQTSSARFYDLEQKVSQLRKAPGQTIRLQLMPPSLGQMEVSIASHRGQVTVNMTVDSEQARQAVEKNLTQLEQQMASSGIKVDQFQVTVNQPVKSTAFAEAEQPYRGGFTGQQGRGYNQSSRDKKLTQHTTPNGPSFETVMVNCLA